MRTIEICRFCNKNIWPWQEKVVIEAREGYLDVVGSPGTSLGYRVELCRHGVCTGAINFYEGLLWKLRHPRRWFRKYIVKEALTGSK